MNLWCYLTEDFVQLDTPGTKKPTLSGGATKLRLDDERQGEMDV